MTEKRFEIREEDIIVEYHELEGLHTCIRNNGEFMTYQQLVDLLNALHEENKELQKERDYYEKRHCEKHNKWNHAHLDIIQCHQKLNSFHEENMIFREFLELNDFDADEILLQGKGLE